MGRRSRDDPAVAGLLLLDKPQGLTSHDVVSRVRRALGIGRVGHSGTLDPMATGLMLVGCGWVTRLLRFSDQVPKTYEAEVTLGIETATWDAEGEVVETRAVAATRDDVAAALQSFVGPIDQVPPMYSAVKVGGEKLYEKARRGEDIDRAPRRVEIHAIELHSVDAAVVGFRIDCSAGTYVRSIAHDLGVALGTGAHLSALRRTRIGPHEVGAAITLDRLQSAQAGEARTMLSPAGEAVAHLPFVEVDDVAAGQVLSGRPMPEIGEGDVAVFSASSGAVLAVYTAGRPAVVRPPDVVGNPALPGTSRRHDDEPLR